MMIGGDTVGVTYTGELDFAETGTGTDYITVGPSYVSQFVQDFATPAELIAITGGTKFTDTFTFSKPISDFLMAIVSLGQKDIATSYYFNTGPVKVLIPGQGGYWGSTDPVTPLTVQSGTILSGNESDGVIEIPGNYSSISFTVPTNGEYWNGFEIGAIGLDPPAGAPLPACFWTGLVLFALVAVTYLGLRRGVGRTRPAG
jgi:hypothetical protein